MSGLGPILIFDKSTLQSLSVDESVWLDAFFYPNITPLFFVETLADLEKEEGKGRTPEQVVGNLAEKTPTGGQPNVHHHTLSVNELLGQPVEMHRVPIVGGGESVVTGEQRGLRFKVPPEREALQRWEEGQFLEVERTFARAWRQGLSGLDLDATYRKGRAIIERLGRPKDLAEAKLAAITVLGKTTSRETRESLQTLQPDTLRRTVLARWNDRGSPSIAEFAPYTAHLLTVDLFFSIALGADLISRDRPSNKVDIAYLYYLPFCMVFTSNDNLHARTASLFLNKDQVFLPGQELKAGLAKLDAHYSALPDEVKARGVMSFAHWPPLQGDFRVSRLWDQLMRPDWRKLATEPYKPMSEEAQRKLFDQVQGLSDAPRAKAGIEISQEEANAIVFHRMVPMHRGKWRLLPPEVAKGNSKS